MLKLLRAVRDGLVSNLPLWQRGYPLERLRALAAPFKAAHKALVFGAFGLTKERDVAEAYSRGRLLEVGDPPAAVAIGKPTPSHISDFRGELMPLVQGGRYVSAFAAKDEASALQLLALIEFLQGGEMLGPCYAEIFEEDAIAKAALASRGWTWLCTKIAAGSEIKGVYCMRGTEEGLPGWERAVLEVLDRSFLSEDEWLRIIAELERGDLPWEQHYSSYNKRKSWSSFALRGYADDPTFIIKPAEMAKAWKEANPALLKEKPRWTIAASRFPWTTAMLDRLLREIGRDREDLDRVRFMRLAGLGELTRHADITDRDAGVADDKVTRLHIPILTHEAVRMIGWGIRGRRQETFFPGGSLCYLDQRKPHAVQNPAGLERIHIVIDVRGSAPLRKKIREAYDGN